MPTALFSSEYQNYDEWYPALMRHMPELNVKRWPDIGDSKDVDVLLVWSPPAEALRFPNLRLIQCLGAGVDHLVDLPIPAHVPLARLIDKSQVQGFVEYVVGAVLSHHRDFHRFRESQLLHEWKKFPRVLAAERKVGIMGLGEMGSPCATRLASFGFSVRGWSRTPKTLPGVQCFSGNGEMGGFLAGLDIIVCVLPLTGETENILSRTLFEQLAPGAYVINVGRGSHCNDRDLRDAISSGRISGALLDVTSVEPLPADNPLWRQKGIEITPHIATSQSASSAAAATVENIRRVRTGLEPLGLVDKSRCY